MCIICGSSEAEPHFGGISCRACAAFFRRYFHSKKPSIKCTCKTRESNSHPCRKCRVQKCLQAGMTAEKVQVCRDKHSKELSRISDSPPSLLETQIIPRDTSNLSFAVSNWHEFETTRDLMNGGKIGYLNIFELSCTVKNDIDLTWKMVHKMFSAMENIKEADKSALLRNFMPKLWQIEL